MLTWNALRVTRHVVIPVEANRLALQSVRQTMETMALARKENRVLELAAVIVCRAHPRRRIHREVVSELEKSLPHKVAPVVRENVAVAEAPGFGLPVAMYAPDSSGAADYREVSRWLSTGLFRS